MKRDARREVTAAKTAAWEQWSQDLGTSEGQLKMFRVARQMTKERKDVMGAKFIKGEDGEIRTEERRHLKEVAGVFPAATERRK